MKLLTLCAGLLCASPALAAVTSVDLAHYQLVATYALPSVAASEASAVTYNWDTGSLFVLGDEGDALVEVSTTGQQLSVMSLTGFDDTEGLTYIGNGQFVLTEERLQDAYRLTYSPGGSASRASLPSVSFGDTVGNIGLEGLSYNPATNSYFGVKEKQPQRIYQATIDWSVPSISLAADPFTPALGVADLSDIQVLASVPSLIGTPDEFNMLIYSQESRMLLEVSPTGTILSSFDFLNIAPNAEGVTIGPDATIYVVGENPSLYVLMPVPEPASLALFAAGSFLILHRRKH